MKKTIITLTAIAFLAPSAALASTSPQMNIDTKTSHNSISYYTQLAPTSILKAPKWWHDILCGLGLEWHCGRHRIEEELF